MELYCERVGGKGPTLLLFRGLDPGAIEVRGLGHNLHLEAPQALARLIDQAILPLLES